jgi:Putative peptidoglycan binding domain
MKHGLQLLLVVIVLAGVPAWPQSSPPPAKPVVKKAVPKAGSTVPKKTVSSKKGKSAKSTKKPAAAAAATWRNRQMEPTPERYKEIQQALVDKGYLKSEPNGIWDAQSSDALLRFQTDKKLSPTGKLSSASLIALGLGPKTADSALSSAGAAGDAPAALPAIPPAPPPAN